MKDQDVMAEIAQLKAQLEALSADQGRSRAAAGAPEPGGGPEGAEAGSWMRDLLKQAEEMIGGLDLQLKDVPARTALIIFALGVLTGRLLSRRG